MSKKTHFIDKYEQPDEIKDYKKFLNLIKDLELYLVKFEKDKLIKTKESPDNCVLRGDKRCPIIQITLSQ